MSNNFLIMTQQEIQNCLVNLGYSENQETGFWELPNADYYLTVEELQTNYFYPDFNGICVNDLLSNQQDLEVWIARCIENSHNPINQTI